ncbi:MAG TPA: NUDIX hydrolase [Methylomusa anaerophila]|uniref:NADH pyrophosphatase n=1 Tax=Methylomusa anaerophila TaxID=1930071 RepID=A0A348AEU4_9FIRM|nr:NUDIX hydrolase [Methylomusa anaerophila]BBB89592.1 NADH pyrophosphatase [Methylomusa anaerophila]HML89635.1 NUDIX hydrolase [Methylomusa anaerophila]
MRNKQVFVSYKLESNETSDFKYCPSCGAECAETEEGGRRRSACLKCGFIHYKNPAPAVSVLIVKEDQVLLGKRAEGAFQAGMWCLPCGFIEFDEDFLTAARREVREETGLTVKIQSILSVMSNYLAVNLHTLVVVLLARAIDGELRPGDDVAAVEWFPLAGPLPEMAFEADAHIIERYRQTRTNGAPVDADFA